MILLLWLAGMAMAALQPNLNLTSFSKEMFWDEPPEGLFNVDVGLQNLTNEHLMAFADLNADKYTDVVTVGSTGKTFEVYMFDTKTSKFMHTKTVTPSDCQKIENIAVGRTQDLLRIFVTCKQEKTGNTIIRFFDRTFDVFFDQVDFVLKIESGS